MIHEPISLTVAWLQTSPVAGVAATITSMLDPRDPLPAVIVARVNGGPVSNAGGIDTIYDWTITVYGQAGKTGPGGDYPDTQGAHSLAQALVAACRAVPTSHVEFDGVRIVDADVITMARAIDEAGNARAVLTIQLRVTE
jgi:hypothetical protein